MIMIRHIVPFILWIGLMHLPMTDVALRYALQVAVCLPAFLVLRPWRHYPALNARQLPLGLLIGVGVGVVWILPESGWIRQFPDIHGAYLRYFVRGHESGAGALFAPEQCGWPLTLVRLGGSALVIAIIEEFFWRGFLMRWMVKADFLSVEPGKVGWGIFMATAILFGLEHDRWLVGVLAGLAYGCLYRRNGDIFSVTAAHVTTNCLLGLYVLATRAYQFW